ncbi:FUSC family protein [Simplicispira psychrophila]|uniref:FUSC family protein n=1 Tax=Simplicispira psychrophila TaxID=80882 RepID=UPI000489F8B4|nr:FUSC family membrane protein [Simplicispira psychrophila]
MLADAPPRLRRVLRVVLSHYVLNGISVALGLLVISAGVHLWLGAFAASAAAVGVIVSGPPDIPAPRRGKFWHLLPAPLLGTPLFFAVQYLHHDALALGLLLVPATFFIFLGMAWGKRGAPVAISLMFAMVFSIAARISHDGAGEGNSLSTALTSTLYFALGALLYVPWAVLANALLNGRYRVQLLSDVLLSLASLMRLQARQFTLAGTGAAETDPNNAPEPHTGAMLLRHAALADQLQGARDLILESPRTPRRQRRAAMLVQILEMRDHLLACELDLDTLRAQPAQAPALASQQAVLQALADEVERLADALLCGRQPVPFADMRARLQTLGAQTAPEVTPAGFTAPLLARGLADRMGHINDEALRLIALARGDVVPDLAVVRAYWQMFVSPTTWSWEPLKNLWHWDAPPLRHAVRAALAMGAGYAVALQLPWGTHAYWVLLTIIVVLRGSLAQTLERRNLRVAGTFLGCVLAVAVLAAQWPAWGLLVVVTLTQAVAHSFALRRYLITAVAATVLGLVQAHLLSSGGGTAFALFERLVDTLIGTGIAWAFAYVLPSWERTHMPALVARTLAAQAHHARVALGLGQLQAVDNAPELAWRLARREAYDSLSALVLATQRSLSEPRAVRPPIESLEHLQAHSYQLLAQLTAVKTLLLLRRGRLQPEQVQGPLALAGERIGAILSTPGPQPPTSAPHPAPSPTPSTAAPPSESEPLPEWDARDLNVWLLRRLHLATTMAGQLRGDADAVLQALDAAQKNQK